VALKNGAWAWLTASIRALAVFAICSISTLYSRRRCFSLATPGRRRRSTVRGRESLLPAGGGRRGGLTLLGGLGRERELFALLHGDLLASDLVVDGGQVLLGQVLAVVDAAVHLDVLLLRHLVLHLRERGAREGAMFLD